MAIARIIAAMNILFMFSHGDFINNDYTQDVTFGAIAKSVSPLKPDFFLYLIVLSIVGLLLTDPAPAPMVCCIHFVHNKINMPSPFPD